MIELDLNREQIEILFKLEYLKTLNDVNKTPALSNCHDIKDKKQAWLDEWKNNIFFGFSAFICDKNANINLDEDCEIMISEIKNSELSQTEWQTLLLQAMMFEPYFPLNLEKFVNDRYVVSKRYSALKYSEDKGRVKRGDDFLDKYFAQEMLGEGGYQKLRNCYCKCVKNLKESRNLPSRPIFLHHLYAYISKIFNEMSVDQISLEFIGSKFIGIDEIKLPGIFLSYLGSGVVSVSVVGEIRQDKGSLGIGKSQDCAHQLKEELLTSILGDI